MELRFVTANGVRFGYFESYRVVRMPGGHFMHREHPERFIRELLAVLRD
ncbi:MAG TPA: hypothetical protein VF316_23865 [Polyangiaceae bacterium]